MYSIPDSEGLGLKGGSTAAALSITVKTMIMLFL
jgi:hypothetical protein